MSGIMRAEFIKLMKRKDFYMLASMVFLPILYSVGAAANSSVITYQAEELLTAFGFFSNMLLFAYMVFIYFIMSAISAMRSLRGEMENGSIKLYIQRTEKRKSVYFSKHMSLITVLIAVFTLLFCVSIICYYSFLVTMRKDIASASFCNSSHIASELAWVFAILLFFVMMVFFSFMVSTFLKTGATIGINILTLVFFMYLKEFPVVQYLSPAFYIGNLIDMSEAPVWNNFFPVLILTLGVCIVTYYIGQRKFIRSDI